MAAAISSGSTGRSARLAGTRDQFGRVNGGITTLTSTPCGGELVAIAVERPDHRELRSRIDDLPGHRTMPAIEAMFTMCPRGARPSRAAPVDSREHAVEVDFDRRAHRLSD